MNLQWSVATLYSGLNIHLYSKANALLGTFGTPLTCSTTPSACSVTFPGDPYVNEAGEYWLKVSYSSDPAIPSYPVLVASLTVKSDSINRTNKTLIQQTIAIGKYRYHRLYFTSSTNLTVILPYTNTTQKTLYSTAKFLRLVSEDSAGTDPYTLSSAGGEIVGTNTDVSTSSQIVRTFAAVPANYSWLVIDITADAAVAEPTNAEYNAITYTYRLMYFTETYPCPFVSDYPDFTGVFKGCVTSQDLSKLPCVLYNSTIGACLACYTGYTLVNGACVENSCPAGYYKKYGQCIANPVGCETFNSFTKCTKCATGYYLDNGVCALSPLTCTGRTFFNSATWTCDNVDSKCKEWDATTGLCTSCISTSEKAVSGKCLPFDQACTSTQFVNANLDCVESDPLCEIFEKVGGKCTKCVWSYEINAAQDKCVKIVCPTRYVPNDYGKCFKVSDLCDVFDARGNCLACIPTHVLQDSGVCLQSEKPNPCPSRQYLGEDNFCHEVSPFCEIYAKEGGECTKCYTNYYLMYTGECVVQTQCKSRQVLINNDCHDVSPTCGNYDRTTGKCLNCASEEYELYYGLCIPVQTCGVRQWTDDNGDCHEVNNRCNTFNPSTGDCTSCVQGYNFLNGICCTKGQYNVNGVCTDAASASSTSNNNGCRTYVNGIGCVRCDSGFQRAQDESGFYYCQSS